MNIKKTICSAMLLISLLALAGCPGVAQESGGSSQSSGSRGGGGE